MNYLLSFFLVLCLLSQPFFSTVNEKVTPMTDKENNQRIESQKGRDQVNIEELLGPKDIYPFLPDNHRDSGTGKFNSF